MKKILAIAFVCFCGLTWFGPWDTYRIPNPQPGDWAMSNTTCVVDLPTWVGWVCKHTMKGVKTQKEAREEEERWLDQCRPNWRKEREEYHKYLRRLEQERREKENVPAK
jgi:hypothetical protein